MLTHRSSGSVGPTFHVVWASCSLWPPLKFKDLLEDERLPLLCDLDEASGSFLNVWPWKHLRDVLEITFFKADFSRPIKWPLALSRRLHSDRYVYLKSQRGGVYLKPMLLWKWRGLIVSQLKRTSRLPLIFFLRVCENWIFLTQTSFLRIRPRALSALSGLNRNHSWSSQNMKCNSDRFFRKSHSAACWREPRRGRERRLWGVEKLTF